MKKYMLMFTAALLLLIQGCATRVATDYEPSHAFVDGASFYIIPSAITPDMSPEISELNLDRIQKAVRQELSNRYSVVDDKTQATYWVQYHVVLKEKLDVIDTSMSFHYSRYPYCCFGVGVDVNQYTEETLIIDVINAKTEKQVWRGSSNYRVKAYSEPQKQMQYLQEKVQKILAEFPPKPEK